MELSRLIETLELIAQLIKRTAPISSDHILKLLKEISESGLIID